MVDNLPPDHCTFVEPLCGLVRPVTWSHLVTDSLPSLKVVFLSYLVLSALVPWAIIKYKEKRQERKESFPFLNLPRELRDMVYEHLVEDPEYPLPPASPTAIAKLSWMLPMIPSLWRSASASLMQYQKPSTWILLANRQIHEEYNSMLVKRATYHMTVSLQNYLSPSSHPPSASVWNISPAILSKIRTCSLQLVTTSAMLGVTDPRNMTSSDWTLAKQIRQDLRALRGVKHFSLESKAIGDPLWNPLWIWYHVCQSFKDMGHPGPQLDKITFSLDTWSPGENYMARDKGNKGAWTWYCESGHSVGLDGGADVTVREFCGLLYRNCTVCTPELATGDADGEVE